MKQYKSKNASGLKRDPKTEFEQTVEDQLKVLGASINLDSPKDILFETLVQLWKKKRAAPSLSEIYDSLAAFSQDNIRKMLHEMKYEHRVLHPCNGVWLPVVCQPKPKVQE